MNPDTQAESQRILLLLSTLIRVLRLSNREIERRVGLSPSYLSRLFGGYLELKMEHILEISRALGLEPEEFFELAYPKSSEPPSESMKKIRAIGDSLRPSRPVAEPAPQPSPGITAEELERLIQEAIRKFFRDLSRTDPLDDGPDRPGS